MTDINLLALLCWWCHFLSPQKRGSLKGAFQMSELLTRLRMPDFLQLDCEKWELVSSESVNVRAAILCTRLIKRGRQEFLSLLNLRFMLGVICTDKDIYFETKITDFSQQLITDCKAGPEGSRTIQVSFALGPPSWSKTCDELGLVARPMAAIVQWEKYHPIWHGPLSRHRGSKALFRGP